MSSVRDAINAITNVLLAPDLELEPEDRELLEQSIGALYDYDEFAAE